MYENLSIITHESQVGIEYVWKYVYTYFGFSRSSNEAHLWSFSTISGVLFGYFVLAS